MPFLNIELFKDIKIQPSLFRIQKKGKIAFLFGTCHDVPLNFLPEAYLKIIQSARYLITEATREEPPSEASFIKSGYAYASKGSNWYQALSSEAFEILQNGLKLLFEFCNMTPIPIERIVPELAYWLCFAANQYEGLDSELTKLFEAKPESKVFPLENHEETTSILPKKTLKELETALLTEYSHLRNNSPQYSQIVIDFMKQYLQGGCLFDVDLVKEQEQDIEMMVNRNLKWLPKILQYYDELEGPVLFAVGAAHLIGRTGLLCSLQKAGFQITQYNLDTNEFVTMNPGLAYEAFGKHIDEATKIIEALEVMNMPSHATQHVIEYVGGCTLLFSDIYSESNTTKGSIVSSDSEAVQQKASI